MIRKTLSKEWRDAIVQKLQERYGLTEKEATRKTNAWLQEIGKQPIPSQHILNAHVADRHTAKPRSRASERA